MQQILKLVLLIVMVTTPILFSTNYVSAAVTKISNDKDCQSAAGVWDFKAIPDENGVSRPDSPNEWNGCWLKDDSANKKLCQDSGGKWGRNADGIEHVPGLTFASFNYCSLPTDLLLDNAAASDYCQKYTKNAENKACLEGYVDLVGACSDYSGAAKKACEDAAENSVYAIVERNSSGQTNIGEDYKKNDCKADAENLNSQNCEIIEVIVLVTNVMSGLAATVIVAMIITGGIQYSMAGAEAAKVQAAKQKITNALLALMLLIFGFSIIQWLIPGGLI